MNKGEIRDHFKAVLNRRDCINSLADTFINQAIGRIQRILRIPSMEKTQNYMFTARAGSVIVPSDLLEILSIYYSEHTLSRTTLREIKHMKQSGQTGIPQYFCRQGESVLIYPEPTSGTLSIDYYGQFADLTTDTSENPLTVIASDLITYTALSYASDYFLDERGQIFEAKSGQFLNEIQEQANEAEQSGTSQSIRPMNAFSD